MDMDKKEELSVAVASEWLELIDARDFGEGWQKAAGILKEKVGRAEFVNGMNEALQPFGKVLSRALKSANFITGLPEVPKGQYVVIQFSTSFENEPSGIETITSMEDVDGNWRVSGYFIK